MFRLPSRFILATIVALLVLPLLLGPAVTPAAAHPADMYFHVHTVHLAPDGLRATWSLASGSMLAFFIWSNADANQDDTVTDAEARAWFEPLLAELYAIYDTDTRIEWRLEAIQWPDSLVAFEVGDQAILATLAADWPEPVIEGEHQLILYNSYEERSSVNWFYVNGETGVGFHTPEQQNGLLQLGFSVVDDPAAADLRVYWDSGTPSLSAEGETSASQPPKDTSASARLTRLVREAELSLTFLLTAFAVSLGLGAIHALTPGHGKALVGAYLVGSRGTTRHAIALGGVVTLTHTGSVLAVGLLTLAASRFFMPTDIFPLLEIASGLLIIGMGLILLQRRWLGFRSVRNARRRWALQADAVARESQAMSPAAPVRLGTPVAVSASASPGESAPDTGTRRTIQIQQAIPVNVYNDVLPPGGTSGGGINWRSLVTLGISGGLVPCPDAIAILLVAVAINRIVFGLSMIMVFSLGLAAVLTAIGIAMVRSQRLLSGVTTFDRMMPALPMVSAIIVLGLGAGLTLNAMDKNGWLPGSTKTASKIDLSVLDEEDESGEESEPRAFRIDQAKVIYMGLDDQNLYQLFTMPALGGEPVAITQDEFGVWDYTLTDGGTIVYTAPRAQSGSDIWQIRRDGSQRRVLIECPTAACTRPTWSPDGERLVYERLDMPSQDMAVSGPPGVVSLWWLDTVSGETGPVFRDSQLPGYRPTWSPDGAWLAFVSPSTSEVVAYNLDDGRRHTITSLTGAAATWSPDSSALVTTNVQLDTPSQTTHLLRFDIASGELIDLTTGGDYGDTWAAWSPTGDWLAVVRRDHADESTNGDQIWLMRPDGGQAHPITDIPDVTHGLPVWSPDGAFLIYQQYPLAGSAGQPGVWMLHVETLAIQQVVERGNWPAWLP